MTGIDVTKLRQWLALEKPLFACLLGVHLATVHRWEACEQQRARIEPLQLQLLALIDAIRQDDPFVQTYMSRQVRGQLLIGGTLGGLRVLLAYQFAHKPKPTPPRAHHDTAGAP
jgi:hypothetical protein